MSQQYTGDVMAMTMGITFTHSCCAYSGLSFLETT